jgi:hypothetical protein
MNLNLNPVFGSPHLCSNTVCELNFNIPRQGDKSNIHSLAGGSKVRQVIRVAGRGTRATFTHPLEVEK